MKSRRSKPNPEPDYPVVYLAEDLFLVDLEEDFLVDVKDFTNTIAFSQMEQQRGADFYRLLYDSSSKNLFRLTPAVRELPPNVELLELPDKSWLDPYRYYVSRGMKPELVPETLLRYARLPKRAKALVKLAFLATPTSRTIANSHLLTRSTR